MPVSEIYGALQMMEQFYPDTIKFCRRLRYSTYGVPNIRHRCIAGTPHLLNNVTTNTSLQEHAQCIQDILQPPSGATMVYNPVGRVADPNETLSHADGTFTNDNIYHKVYRSIDQLCCGLQAHNPLRWSRPNFTLMGTLTPRDHATVQSFPRAYMLPESKQFALLGVGNSVPPLFARKLMSIEYHINPGAPA